MTRVSFSRAWWTCALALLVGVGGVGVAMGAEEAVPSERPPEATVLPEWAPDDPSDAFLLGLRALAALPTEQVLGPAEGDADLTAFLKQMMETVWPPAFELFGSLTDEQRAKFFAESEVRLPAASLPEAQGAALDRWFAAMDRVLATAPELLSLKTEEPRKRDYRAVLRSEGAADDLSNVEVGFGARNGLVGLYFWVKPAGDQAEALVTNDFAMLKGEIVAAEEPASEE